MNGHARAHFITNTKLERTTIGVFCPHENINRRIRRRLEEHFVLQYPASFVEAQRLIENLQIYCLVNLLFIKVH